MSAYLHSGFQRMDRFSAREQPFFFLIDFEVQQVEVYSPDELKETGICVQFAGFQNTEVSAPSDQEIVLKSVPSSFQEYQKGFEIVQQHLQQGNSYLINYTCESPVTLNTSLKTLFGASAAKYKIYAPGRFVCFSPETFVQIRDNTISTEPMKGTIEADLENAAAQLLENKKETAEHYTVVDLLRNDLSHVADDVTVQNFRRLDLIKTAQKDLLAMSSEITGQLRPEFCGKIGSVLQELLPAGSVLGAPKKKTLEIIKEAESHDRGFYCGIAGYFDGHNLDSCVMIRFIEARKGNLFFKSGGGITHLSTAEEEYEEMKNKIYVPVH
ncbi:aminodeoxychorismate synthase component I [Chryseobacterium salipaludis]|uniref:aminodeoxychorismate synthase component I n=1 Tax=Chryseobacterium TaxID=59732 RepID=UPI001FF5E1F9|nr:MULTISPECIES: aminodeoxychorismate synthase component I [Chryseobacterium]MCJ8497300.1 aminodeoxychorismate synthase component I [Chryseobacterium salipaludis]MCX3295707.1 aminodeoxychorismate synthase component I [Planobacterium sp. JC490]